MKPKIKLQFLRIIWVKYIALLVFVWKITRRVFTLLLLWYCLHWKFEVAFMRHTSTLQFACLYLVAAFIVARLCMLLFLMQGYICFCCYQPSLSCVREATQTSLHCLCCFAPLGPTFQDGQVQQMEELLLQPFESMLINQIASGCLIYLLPYLLHM